jgi:hypothetical protein
MSAGGVGLWTATSVPWATTRINTLELNHFLKQLPAAGARGGLSQSRRRYVRKATFERIDLRHSKWAPAESAPKPKSRHFNCSYNNSKKSRAVAMG